MEVLKLIRSQIRCLERFKEASQCFLADTETGDFSQIDDFEKSRATLLKGFALFDRKITESVSLLPQEDRTPQLIAEVERLLAQKTALIGEILSVDDRIIERIAAEQRRISAEAARAHRSTSVMKKFKSGWVPESGDKLDETL